MIALAHFYNRSNNISKAQETMQEISKKILADSHLQQDYLVDDFSMAADMIGCESLGLEIYEHMAKSSPQNFEIQQ